MFFVNMYKLIVIIFVVKECLWTALAEDEEYCLLESFEPKCPNYDDVILITSAKYGRMKVGKCINDEEMATLKALDPKLVLGCYRDVTNILHDRCSLKKSCTVKIPDPDMDTTKPCFSGLKLHLSVQYKCISVSGDSNCHLQTSKVPKHLIITPAIEIMKCLSPRHPYIIETSKGQKIRLSTELTDDDQKEDSERFGELKCDEEIGHIVERDDRVVRRNVTLCRNGLFVEKPITVMKGNALNGMFSFDSEGFLIEIFGKETWKNKRSAVLVKFEAIGCRDIIQPEDTWMQRNGDEMVIGCFMTKQKWYLRCQDRSWTGVIGNCSIYNGDKKKEFQSQKINDNVDGENQVLLMVLICGVGIVLCSLVVCVGAVCMRKYSVKKLPTTTTSMYNKQQPTYYLNDQPILNNNFNETTPVTSINENNNMTDENKYFILENE